MVVAVPKGSVKEVKVVVMTLSNLTTHMDIGRTDPDNFESSPFHCAEIMEDGLIIEVPHRSCSSGHSLKMILHTSGSAYPYTMEITAKVLKVEELEGVRQQITVKFLQHDTAIWEKIKQSIEAKQDNVMDLFKTMKGTG